MLLSTSYNLERYIRPVESLLDLAKVKAGLALLYAGVVGFIHAEGKMLGIAALLVIIDLITGVISAKRNGTFKSLELRQTALKVSEYLLFLTAFILVALYVPWLSWLREAAFVYVALTELKSITENVHGLGAYNAIFKWKNAISNLGDEKNHDDEKRDSTES